MQFESKDILKSYKHFRIGGGGLCYLHTTNTTAADGNGYFLEATSGGSSALHSSGEMCVR